MRLKYSLIVLLPSLFFFSYLISVDQQSAFMFSGLFLVFGYLIYLSIKTKNNVLTATIALGAIAHVIGAPLFILNKEDYSYSGWNAIKDFDFSTSFFLQIYTYVFSAIILLILFTWVIERVFRRSRLKRGIPTTELATQIKTEYVKPQNITLWTIVFVALLILAIILAVVMYVYNIAILGIESERLPFKLVGILFYLRGYGLPILLFIIFRKTSQSKLLNLMYIVVALFVGALSASRGVTFIYLFPVLVGLLITKITVSRIILVVSLILLGYFTTSITRDVVYSTSNLSIFDLPSLLLSSRSSFQSDEGLFLSLLSIIGTISNRLYGAQDSVLAYQHILVEPWNSFVNFMITGSLVPNLAEDLYGLVFLPGMGYGVGLGLIGLLVMIGKADFILLIFAVFFFSILMVIANRVLRRLFINPNTGKFYQLYYLILFITAFNFLQATLPYLYTIICVTWILGFFFNKKVLK